MCYVKDVFGDNIRVGDAMGGTAYTPKPELERTILMQNKEIDDLRLYIEALERVRETAKRYRSGQDKGYQMDRCRRALDAALVACPEAK